MGSARFSTFAYATIIHIWQWKKPIIVILILICGSKSMFYGWRSAMLIIPSDSLFSKYEMKKKSKNKYGDFTLFNYIALANRYPIIY